MKAGSTARSRLTKEKVVSIGTPASDLEYLDQVVELAVDVADNGHRGPDVNDIAFSHQELLRLGADRLDDRLGEKLLLVEPLDALIEIDRGCVQG